MNKSFLLLTSVLVLATASAQSLEARTLMTTRGASVVTDNLSAADQSWKAGKGTWQFVDGALQGAERKADAHAATYRRNLSFQDGVIQFDFKLGDAKMLTFSINDAKGHVARVLVDAKGFQARKDDHDHKGPDKAVNFNRVNTPISAATWYTMLLEIRGSEMLARLVVDDSTPLEKMPVSFGAQEMIGVAKTNIGFTVVGETASFRNLRVHAALENATWTDTKKVLEAARPR
jgi:hypothetical protein